MKEIYGNVWDMVDDFDCILITTNGFVKKNGEAVMGRGIALEAKTRFPGMPKWLGSCLSAFGNRPYLYPTLFGPDYVTLPVKPVLGPNGEPGWRARADIDLIVESLTAFNREFADTYKRILLPRPGCGNGGLSWEVVKPIIEPLIDDRYTVISRG